MILLKKTVHDNLVAKIKNIDTSEFFLKIKYDSYNSDLEIKFMALVGLLKN